MTSRPHLAHTARTSFFAAACLLSLPVGAQSPPQIGSMGPLVLIGVDGLSFEVIEPLVAAGRLPHFAALMDSGATAILKSERPMRSPALWTTIATGQPRAVHGIYDFVTGSAYWPRDQRDEPERLVTSDMRRSPALWDLAAAHDRRSLIVGWLNTWPAEAVDGVMVAPYVALGTARQTSIKGKIYKDIDRQSYPPALFDELRPLILRAKETPSLRMAQLVDVPPKEAALFRAVPQLRRYLYTVRWSIASALSNIAILEHQLARGEFDLVMTYFDGADTLGHRFWLMRQPLPEIRARLRAHGIDPSVAEELKARLAFAIDGYYELIDELVGRLRVAAGPQANIMIISDHGWGALPSPGKAPYDHVPFDGEHRLDGVFIASGPAVRHGHFDPLTLYDIAPTVLHLIGAGVPVELPGRVATEMLWDDLVRSSPPLIVATCQRPPTRIDAPVSPEAAFVVHEMERLRSLGYVQ